MKAKKLRLYNGIDWTFRDGRLYVAAHSLKDAMDLINEAYRNLKGKPADFYVFSSLGYLSSHWSKGSWGNSMKGVVPERGVWWQEKEYGPGSEIPPRRIL